MPATSESFNCPFCHQIHALSTPKGTVLFNCLGEFYLDILACQEELNLRKYDEKQKQLAWAQLGYYIARNYLYFKREPHTGIPPVDFVWVLDHYPLPTPMQQMENLLVDMAHRSMYIGEMIKIPHCKDLASYQLQYWIGAVDRSSLITLIRELEEKRLIKTSLHSQVEWRGSLTISGWEKVKQLEQINQASKKVFLAMKFDKDHISFLKNTLAPALKEIGFELNILSDIPSKENLIDNKLRVAIQQSRFLICDLTHGNHGAYWEAGYAEGLGLPVIYICEESVFESADNKPHFDVNHQQIFTWKQDDKTSIKEFVEQFKAKVFLVTN